MQCEHRLEKSKMNSKICCKACYIKQWRDKNPEYNKQWNAKNAERRKQYKKQYHKRWRDKNPDKIKQWRDKNPDKIKQYNKQYNKQWRDKNPDKIKQYQKQYQKQRKQTDPMYKMITNMRSRLYEYSKLKACRKTWDLLGCSPNELREWLEGQFKEGMNWDNQGEWHIDHILPLCVAETKQDFKILAHYTNLQPLWAEDNFKKGGW